MKRLICICLAVLMLMLPAMAITPAGALRWHGADISYAQGTVSFSKAAKAADFLYIRAGAGNSHSDGQHIDKLLAKNAAGAKAAGIPFGFYWFLRPSTDKGYVREQADRFYQYTMGYKAACRPALDVEMKPGKSYTVPHFSAAMVKASVKAFMSEYKTLSGKTLMIYASPSYANSYLNNKSFASDYYWEAHYTSAAQPRGTKVWSSYVMWQYTSKGSVAGIKGHVDRDRACYLIFWPSTTVRAVQRQLITIGYPLTINGLLDAKTTAAVTDMQRRNTQAVSRATGKLDAATKSLIARIAAKYSKKTSTTKYKAIKPGDTGSRVQALQKALNKHGAKLKADGVYGAKTGAAVYAYQKRVGLAASHIAGPRTCKSLGVA